MMEVKYYKELNHNYLILKRTADIQEQDYQIRMITENKFNYLLPCITRNVNNEICLYYEISSKQSIKHLFEKEKISYQTLFHLMESVNEAAKEAKNYLLLDRYLLLSPEYIFANLEKEIFCFIYYPFEEENNMTEMSFAEFLVEAIDHNDEKAVDTVYKIYEIVQSHNFVLSDILRLFEENSVEKDIVEKNTIEENIIDEEMSNQATQETELFQNWEKNEMEPESMEFSEKEDELHNRNKIVSSVLLFLCMIASASIFCIRYFFELSIEESLITIAGIAAFIIIGASLLIYLIISPIKRSGKKKTIVDNINKNKMDEREVTVYEEVLTNRGVEDKGNMEYGATVFLESAVLQKENKLYGINKGNKYHIDIENAPFTVGKMAGSVDFVIKHESISRIHARFTKEEGKVYVTDLNSTNGTFKNGLRLEPNETISIEAGDEIRLGKMEFCYR